MNDLRSGLNNENKNVATVAGVAHKIDATNATTVKLSSRERRITKVRTANDCIKEAKALPEMEQLFGCLWQTGQVAFLVGDTGVGKSILTVNLAKSIADGKSLFDELPSTESEKSVLYYDFELSDRQFAKRFRGAEFPSNFYRVVVDDDFIDNRFSIDNVRADVEEYNADIVIIDNLSALSLKTAVDPEVAIGIMRSLKVLQKEKNISILVLAHTPKLPSGMPLCVNSMAGSKALSNFADSIFFISRAKEGKEYRYIKQVKSRDAEELDGVVLCKINDENDFLSFEFVGIDSETNQIISDFAQPLDRIKLMETCQKLKGEGKTLDEIGQIVGKNKSTISRWLN